MIRHYLQKHGHLWRDRRFLFSLGMGLLILGLGLGAAALAREHLEHALRVEWSPDIFLDHLPVLKLKDFLVWGVELLLIVLVPILLLYPEYIPFSLKSVGLLYLVRSFFVILTPLGNRPDRIVETTQGFFYNLAYASNDFFFSGHVSFPFMLALVFWKIKPIRYGMLLISLAFAVAVLLAHTHYSIDVFSVPLIVPTIFGVSRYLFVRDVRTARVNYTGEHADHVPPLL